MTSRRQHEKQGRHAEETTAPAMELHDDAPAAGPGVSGDPPAGEAAPGDQLAKVQAEKEELFQSLVRRQADFENYRKRVERERQDDRSRATALLVEQLLPVLDGFERALAAHEDPAYEDYRKGFELIYKQLWAALARHGLERIDAVGKPFDPHVHHAIERVETPEYADGTVLQVLQEGYTLRERVLRPALVRVAAHPMEKTAHRESGE